MQTLKPDSGKAVLSWVYFHGRLADRFGTDLIENTDYPPCGVREVKVAGVQDRCLAFIWTNAGFMRGLITMIKDRKATQDAYTKYFKRSPHL